MLSAAEKDALILSQAAQLRELSRASPNLRSG